MNKYKNCYECPNYDHAGAFGSPRYKPQCKGKTLPYDVDRNNYASPKKNIRCIHLDN